jgi:hypothetical protein
MWAVDPLAPEHPLDVATRDAGIRLAHEAQLPGRRDATPPRGHHDLVRGLGGWRGYGWLGHDDQAPFSALRCMDFEEVTVSGIVHIQRVCVFAFDASAVVQIRWN